MSEVTRSERYFIDLFHSSNLSEAVERAAQTARSCLRDQSDRSTAWVDVFKIAKQHQIHWTNDLVGPACEEGILIPLRGGYRVRLKRSSTDSRRRFSLAHELGHTFFYKDKGSGPRHQIGVLSTPEKRAEERVCNLFASALLMPSQRLRERLAGLPERGPSQVLKVIECMAHDFRVSVQALLVRLGSVQIDGPSYVLLSLTNRQNPSKGGDPTLRVDECVSIGKGGGLRIWRNKSAAKAGLHGALSLFRKWTEAYPEFAAGRERRSLDVEKRGVAFVFDPRQGLIQGEHQTFDIDSEEKVLLSEAIGGKHCPRAVISSSRLYAWNAGEQTGAYVVSVLAVHPTQTTSFRPVLDPVTPARSITQSV